MTARFIVADVFDGLATLETGSVDLVVTSPPFLALRSYLPADHADKSKEIGSEATPAEFIDTLLKVTAELRRVLAPHGSICIELGDTYAGSGGGGGDYLPGGWREGQQHFVGSEEIQKRARRSDDSLPYEEASLKTAMRESNAAHWRQKNAWRANTAADDREPIGGRGKRSGRAASEWPLAKSRTLIPSLYEIALAYGINPLTGIESPAGQWRIRNVVTWARPNPPVGALGDKWRPATSDLIVACTSGKRYWDDLATRKPHQSDPASYSGNGYSKGFPEGIVGNESMPGNSSGAPLLDYWVIPPGGYSGSVATEWKRPVDRRESVGDIRRTTSSDCPEHGDQAGPPATGSHDEPESVAQSPHNSDSGSYPVQGQLDDSVPTDQTTELVTEASSSDSLDQPYVPVAKPHSKASNRMGLAPATNPPGKPSEETSSDIAGRPTSPLSDVHHPDTAENRTSEDGSDGSPASQTPVRTPDSDILSEPCTCSYYVLETKYTSHYAVFPEELVVPCVKAMCPPKVCRTCGEPSRRITGEPTYVQPNGTVLPNRSWESGLPDGKGQSSYKHGGDGPSRQVDTLGWTDCGHNNYRLGLILDPFAGSGTTLTVATGHGHDAIGIDLDQRNAELARDRVGPFLFDEVLLDDDEVLDLTHPQDVGGR